METMITEGPYELINKNSLNRFISTVSSTLNECETLIDKKKISHLSVTNPIRPQFHSLPKIYKICNRISNFKFILSLSSQYIPINFFSVIYIS